jgi:hypothetical protein
MACDPGPPLELGPCAPDRVKHVALFGYYAIQPQDMSEVAPYSNLVWSGPAAVAPARAAGQQAIVDVQSVFDIPAVAPPSPDAIAARWAAVANQLRPDVSAIAALYACDEPYWNGYRNGVPFDQIQQRLESAAAMVHATAGFEQVRLAVIFADPELDWIHSGEAKNPAGYAWVGWDLYRTPVDETERRANLFLSLVRPEQRVIAVPDAFLAHSDVGGLEGLHERIAFWLAWVERHPQVVAITPFIYQDGRDSTWSWTGAKNLPSVRGRYAQIGKCVIAATKAGAAGT